MKNVLYRKTLVIGIILLFAGAALLPSIGGNLGFESFESVRITVQTNGDNTEITYQINEFKMQPVRIEGVEYSRILLESESNLLLKGIPDMPNICRSIVIHDTAKMGIRVTSATFETFEDVLIAPSKGNLLRTVNPENVPFEFDEMYNVDEWYPRRIAELGEPYVLRDFRGLVVKIYPFQYNPVRKILRFYTDITVDVYPNGVDNYNCIYREILPKTVNIDFKQIYEHHFINFNNDRYDPVGEQGNLLVITYDNFWDTMVPFVQWKNMKGIPTEMVKVSTIGNANAIKSYIANYYNTNSLTFVLLVGDAAQIPTLYAGGYASDPSYSYIVGGDHYPDLFVGRFSAENIAQLETQVERSIEYEKYPQTGVEWYHKGTGIASTEGPGDDGEYDHEHMNNIRDKLLAYTYTEVGQFYGYSASANDVTNALNEGRGIANYCGHGSTTSWGTTGFSNNHINALVNDNMLPFITSVACVNGNFVSTTCFAEAWMRATHDEEPTGSIANFMSAKYQSWSPPMDAQDEFVDMLVESYEDNKKTTFGALCFNGCMHMNDEYGSAGWTETDAWTVFGDPSLQVRTDTPSDMTVSHDPEVDEGATTFEVTVSGIENALCAISRDYTLLGYGYTDDTGHTVIEFDEPITGEESLDLVVTAYNKIPYIAQIIVNSPPETPETPTGPTEGKPNEEYTFSTRTADPDDDQVYYMWD